MAKHIFKSFQFKKELKLFFLKSKNNFYLVSSKNLSMPIKLLQYFIHIERLLDINRPSVKSVYQFFFFFFKFLDQNICYGYSKEPFQ